MLPALMASPGKVKVCEGLDGSWLLVVVATQSVSVLATVLPGLQPIAAVSLRVALAAWALAFIGLARSVLRARPASA